MKKRGHTRFRAIVATILIVGFSLLPFTSFADACDDGRAMANNEVNGAVWFGIGCLGGPLGVGAAYVVKPDPPTSALVGKPADYIAKFTDCYRDEAKGIQAKNAWIGCVIINLFYAVALVGSIVALSEL